MNKSILRIVSLLGLSFFVCSVCLAVEFPTSTTLPAGTLNVHISKIDSRGTKSPTDDVWPPAGSPSETSLAFGPLKEVTGVKDGKKWVVFLPANNSYFAIENGISGGGFPSGKTIQISYDSSGTGGPELGERVVAAYVKTVEDKTGKTTDTLLAKEILSKTKSFSVDDVKGGWLRMYVGIATGDPEAGEPADAKTFSPADAAQNYEGGLIINFL